MRPHEELNETERRVFDVAVRSFSVIAALAGPAGSDEELTVRQIAEAVATRAVERSESFVDVVDDVRRIVTVLRANEIVEVSGRRRGGRSHPPHGRSHRPGGSMTTRHNDDIDGVSIHAAREADEKGGPR